MSYKFYQLDLHNRKFDLHEEHDFDADETAIEHAKRIVKDFSVGIWHDARLVCFVSKRQIGDQS
jgi:hypothetical protein